MLKDYIDYSQNFSFGSSPYFYPKNESIYYKNESKVVICDKWKKLNNKRTFSHTPDEKSNSSYLIKK